MLPGPRSGIRPIITSRSTAMQPAVGEKVGPGDVQEDGAAGAGDVIA